MSRAESFCLLRTDFINFSYENTFFFLNKIHSRYSAINYRSLEYSVGHNIFSLKIFSNLKIISFCKVHIQKKYFQWNGKYYKQIIGCAMGSTVSPQVSIGMF